MSEVTLGPCRCWHRDRQLCRLIKEPTLKIETTLAVKTNSPWGPALVAEINRLIQEVHAHHLNDGSDAPIWSPRQDALLHFVNVTNGAVLQNLFCERLAPIDKSVMVYMRQTDAVNSFVTIRLVVQARGQLHAISATESPVSEESRALDDDWAEWIHSIVVRTCCKNAGRHEGGPISQEVV
jgi:hypothetical protein